MDGMEIELRSLLRTEGETRSFGRHVGTLLKPGDWVALVGDLGSGKTTLVSGILESLVPGARGRSPTYVLVEVHPGPVPVIHADLFRLRSPRELQGLALDDLADPGAVVLIEWADRAEGISPRSGSISRYAIWTGRDASCASGRMAPAGIKRRATASSTAIGGSMPYILGIDTSAPEGSVALSREGREPAIEILPPGGHSSGLSAAVGRLLEGAGVGLDCVSAFAVNEGPGSFTGLRIGLAWAKGAALGTKRPLVLVRAHDAMALAHAADAERLVTAIPGARGLVEAALWERGITVWGPETLEEGDLIPALLERGAARGLAIVPSTPKLARSLAEEAAEEEIDIVALRPLAPAVASIGVSLLGQGRAADLASASPAYGREPNARKPAS